MVAARRFGKAALNLAEEMDHQRVARGHRSLRPAAEAGEAESAPDLYHLAAQSTPPAGERGFPRAAEASASPEHQVEKRHPFLRLPPAHQVLADYEMAPRSRKESQEEKTFRMGTQPRLGGRSSRSIAWCDSYSPRP